MTRSTRITGGSGLILLLVSLMIGLGAPAFAGADPPGNNGTVKIDGVEFDSHPDNEPHVGCVFQVDFYGFDQGDLWANVSFAVQPPTGPFEPILTDTVFIGEDAAGGGTDLDNEAEYDLAGLLAGYAQHPEQGWHLKLTVNAAGAVGADVKHKVFWVTCTPPTSTTTSSTTSSTTSTTSSTQPTTTSTSSSVPFDSVPQGETEVLGIEVSAPEPAQVGQTEVTLPFTGLPTGWVALLAIAIGGAGALLLLAARPPDKDDPLRSWN